MLGLCYVRFYSRLDNAVKTALLGSILDNKCAFIEQ